ncbi:carboxypeptidase regulatory-like domain-containing protein [Ascidiimonas sp. W6]|uniref:carboxypeptidase regulatory-like domain-containing protein n=1 Tax=Ascidiimonas meishanensis TaxID=3128903 RepID=UPI0030ECC7A7
MMKKIIYVLFTFSILISCSEDKVDTFVTGEISGTVVSDGDNEPIENVKISTSPNSKTVFTNANGEFTLEEVPTGDYSLKAEKDGWVTNFEAVSLTESATVTVIFELELETATNRPPATPVLITPTDLAIDVPVEQQFVWNASDPDATDELTFTLEIKNAQDDEILKIESLTDTVYTVSDLDFGTKYFWQITVSDSINEPVLSKISSFTTLDNPENRFHYVQQIGGNNVIISSNEDGSTQFRLTDENQNSYRPKKNLQAGRIAFLRNIGAQTHLFTSDLSGDDIRQVTQAVPVAGFNLNEIEFDWSSNGSQLIYPSFDKLYKINKDGSGLELVFQTSDGSFITKCAWSEDGSFIALTSNNSDGYNGRIFTIDLNGNITKTLLSGLNGAMGGLDISIDGSQVLYTYDVSGFENNSYRRLDSRVFVYTLASDAVADLSIDKPTGTNDLNAKFSPNNADIIFENTSNDGISPIQIVRRAASGGGNRFTLFNNASMPDWQ